MQSLPPESPARLLARLVVESMLDKSRNVYGKYVLMKDVLQREFGLEAVGVGEIVECRRLIRARATGELEADQNITMLFHGTVVEKGIREELNLRKGDLAFRRVGNYLLFGSSDALLNIGDMQLPVEIKSSMSFTLPRDSHFLQCSLYAFLYRVPYGILMFLSRKFRIYVVPAVDEQTVTRLLSMWKELCPLFVEECKHCPLRKLGRCSGGDRDLNKRSWLYNLTLSLRRASAEVIIDRDFVRDVTQEVFRERNKGT